MPQVKLPGTNSQTNEQPQPFTVEDFGGLDTKAKRPAIGPKDFYILENWMPIGPGNMRTLYDKAETPIYTTVNPRTILNYAFYNIGSDRYAVVFLDNGTAIQVNTETLATTTISAVANTFYSGTGALPTVAQYQAKWLVITSQVGDDAYWIWNGTSLFAPGTLGPKVTMLSSGRGTTPYTSPPTVTAYGGAGAGATFLANLGPQGHVTDVEVTNPGSGYDHEDRVTLVFTGGGGQNQARATATVATATGGVAIVTVTAGGSAYTAPVVTFAGGGGSGARAFVSGAANGVVTDITVTDPGSGYTSSPTVTIADSGGGAGAGATAVAEIRRGQITAITVNSGGAGYTGQPEVLISAPNDLGFPSIQAEAYATITAGAVSAITVSNRGVGYASATVQLSGGNNSAEAEIGLMPYGVKGSSIETYKERVWIGDDTKLLACAADELTVFAASLGGVADPITDSFLRERLVALKQANGFLYRFGDSSINVISNVQTSNGGTTTFNDSNVDPQIGTAWRDSVIAFGRALVFANPTGVYALYGGAAEKVSDQLDGLFANASFNTGQSGKEPSAFVATVFGIRMYGILFTTTTPGSQTLRDIIACWDGRKWFLYTPSALYRILASQSIDSELYGYLSTSTAIYLGFDHPSDTLVKTFATKLLAPVSYIMTTQALDFYFMAEDNAGDGGVVETYIDTERGSGPVHETDVSTFLTWTGIGGAALTWTGLAGAPLMFTSRGLTVNGFNQGTYGQLIGATVQTSMPDVVFISLTMLVKGDYSAKAG